jgi:membrane protein
MRPATRRATAVERRAAARGDAMAAIVRASRVAAASRVVASRRAPVGAAGPPRRAGSQLWPVALMGLLVMAGWRGADPPRSGSRPRTEADRSADRLEEPRDGDTDAEAGTDADAEADAEADDEDEDGGRRGRLAERPSAIPAKGWKDILLRVYRRISRDRILAIAAGVAFYVLLAVFPAIAALVAVYGLFADPATIGRQVQALSGLLPGGAIEVVRSQAERLASQPSGTLGGAFALGLVTTLWSANAGMKAIFDALNVAYAERERRGFLRLNAVSLAFTIGLIGFLVIALGAIVVLPHLLAALPLGPVVAWAVTIGKWPVLLLGVAVLISLLYRFGPSRMPPRWRWVTWGSAFAALTWIAGSILFSWYAANFGSYNKTYGSLGAAVGFMTWLWLSSVVVLVGALLNAEMEHQTARDTTAGPAKPRGRRGATMADTVGRKAA